MLLAPAQRNVGYLQGRLGIEMAKESCSLKENEARKEVSPSLTNMGHGLCKGLKLQFFADTTSHYSFDLLEKSLPGFVQKVRRRGCSIATSWLPVQSRRL